MEETSVFENFEMQLDQSAKDFLKETAKWAYFLSILGFIGVGLFVVFAIFAGAIFASLGNTMGAGLFAGSLGAFMSFVYLAFAALYFFPVYYLFRFGSNAKRAFRENDSEALTSSLGYLKSHYKFIGILMVTILSLYALIFVLAMLGGILGR
ncbi:hypothetical protein EYY60_10100 [Flavobacterium zhairuonense]|uniref:hypothetical protein n=1 Tax=Flavobacterium zhairuonense TaxID=2493631 RepID=UPI001050F1C5|nr:hypothetical protein [Flavobacterium zhairuonense]KAF2510846.1 hypothetical protein EYY60_10100 [Flavobacterium zhairuonense]